MGGCSCHFVKYTYHVSNQLAGSLRCNAVLLLLIAAGPGPTSKGGADFEVVPAPDSGSDSGTDSEDEFNMLDDHGRAEVLAIAKKMLRRKDKESIVDAAYNRYAFHDTALPKWFADDERRYMR